MRGWGVQGEEGKIQRVIKPDIHETARKEEAHELHSLETLALCFGVLALGFHSDVTK